MTQRIDFGKRPKCICKGCNNDAQLVNRHKDGTPVFRKICTKHQSDRISRNNGVSNVLELTAKRQGMTPAEYKHRLLVKTAKKKGFSNINDYKNSIHPYRKHRKLYCENKDGRLGYKCRVKIRVPGQLQVDHKNGNPKDNRLINLQTLCSNCHIYKTHKSGDNKTPGRNKLAK